MAAPLSPRAVNRQTRGVKEKASANVSKVNDEKYARPPPPVVQDPAGQRYESGRELGKGGFAICYEATVLQKENRASGVKVALKTVKAEMGVKKMEEKFRTELQIHSRMRHPNIVEFHRAFTYGKSTYIVLELCPNGSLKDMCSRRKVLSMPEVRRYGIQICGAVKYMHAKNVVHRDLKMGNLFMDQEMNIKIGDFGLAAIYLNETDAGFVSRRTTLCGTPNYIAPEILDRKNGHDHKVDLWAIGVILYTLMIGKPPFSRQGDKNNDAVYQRVKIGDYEWPKEARNDVPTEAKDLISLLLIPDAEARPEPDEIVDHAFFCMRRGRDIPATISPSCMTSTPSWLGIGVPRGDTMLSSAPRIQHDTICHQCGVGSAAKSIQVGAYYGQSLYQDFLLEEAAGRTPVVPLPEGTIYSWNPPRISLRARPTNIRAGTARLPARSNPSTTTSTRVASAASARIPASRSNLPIRGPSTRSEAATKASSAPTQAAAIESRTANSKPVFGAADPVILVDRTAADDVLSMLKDLVTNLSLCLHSTNSSSADGDLYSASLDQEVPRPPVVVKWVDYSNKFGIGYLLENGTIGCIFQAAELPLSSIVVADVENHLAKRNKSSSYVEKNQIVRKDGAPIDFYAPNPDPQQPLLHLPAHPKRYQVQSNGRLAPSAEAHDSQRRQLLGLWDKFARFMTQTLGKAPDGSSSSSSNNNSHGAPSRPFVRFYQRLGNVGVWGFSDGGFQFNFPDHTKLLLARDGCWADFYHLPLDAARRLHAGHALAKDVLDRRAVLRMPLWRMLRVGAASSASASASASASISSSSASASASSSSSSSAAAAAAATGMPVSLSPSSYSTIPSIPTPGPAAPSSRVTAEVLHAIVVANELRQKVEFVKDVMRSWLKLGGLGRARPGEKVLWGGMAEEMAVGVVGGDRDAAAVKVRKLDWVTIGL